MTSQQENMSTNPIKMLLLEDSAPDAEIIFELLASAGFNVLMDRAENKADYIGMLAPERYKIILFDFRVPGFDGFQALKLARQYCPDTPVICVSGTIGEETAVELLKEGATDYVLKDRLSRLPYAINNAIKEAETLKQQRLASSQLKMREQQLRSFIEQSSVGMCRTGADGKIIMANQILVEMLGFQFEDELAGRRLSDLGISKDYSRVQELLKEKGFVKNFETLWHTLSGRSLTVRLNIKTITNDAGDIQFFDGIIEDITGLKKAADELAESRELFHTLALMSPVGIFKTRADGFTTYVNSKWTRLSGLPYEKALGFGWLDAVHPEDREGLISSWTRDCKAGSQSYAEYRFLRPDNTIVWVIGNAVPEIVDGKLIGYIGTVTDVSEIRHYEKRLRTLSLSVEQSPVAIMLVDTSGNIEYVNPRFEELTGYSVSEIIGQNIQTIRISLPSAAERQKMWEDLIAGKNWKGELQSRRKDGTLFWESITVTQITSASGQVSHFLAVIEDITGMKQLLNKVLENEAQLNLISTSTQSVLYRLNYSTMQYEYMNPVIEELIGYTPGEINRIGFAALVLKVEGVRGTELVTDELKKNRPSLNREFHADYLVRTKSGSERWLADSSYPWYDSDGNLVGSLGILSDITIRKNAEHDLIVAKEKAEEMDRLKTNLLSNMSHELRTPLISILGYSELISLEETSESIKEMAGFIIVGGNRLLSTLNNLLQFSVINSQDIVPKYRIVDINPVIEEILKEFYNEVQAKELELKTIFDPDLPPGWLDKIFLREIMIRLINNAIKFTQRGTVTVETAFDSKNIYIKVHDTGVGISAANQKVIFQEFRQASEGFNRSFEGTGLGLTIADRYVKVMNGEISLSSNIDEGSTFTISFPVPEGYVAEPKTPEIVQANTVQPVKRARILYVENDVLSVKVVTMFLREYHVEHALNGPDALRMAKTCHYDAFLMDINLDDKTNGLDVTQELRSMEEYKSTPIIAVTAYALHDDEMEFLKNGCSHYLAKPFRKQSLLKLINSVLAAE